MAEKNILASTLTFLESISGNLNILLISEKKLYAQTDNFSSKCRLSIYLNSRLRQGHNRLVPTGINQDERHFLSYV